MDPGVYYLFRYPGYWESARETIAVLPYKGVPANGRTMGVGETRILRWVDGETDWPSRLIFVGTKKDAEKLHAAMLEPYERRKKSGTRRR